MQNGFLLQELRLSGASVKDASVVFKIGVNIITGPSNTGKTYIFQCLNYMFGGSKTPKPIKEARPYEFIYLEIVDLKGASYTLMSDLKGGISNFLIQQLTILKLQIRILF